MRADALTMSLLYDYYGELLTEKQRQLFDLYYDQDYSLSEIAAAAGISRQGVHDTLARAEELLEGYERTLGCMSDRTPDTFYGALHTLYTSLIEKFPESPIIVLTPLHRLNEDNPRGDGNKPQDVGVLKTYVEIIRAAAEAARGDRAERAGARPHPRGRAAGRRDPPRRAGDKGVTHGI